MAGLHNMMMGMGYGVTITLQTGSYGVDDTLENGGSIEWGLLNESVITNSSQNGQQSLYNWITPSSQSPNYWIRVTQVSGTIEYGSSVNTWIDTADNPFWGISRISGGTTEITFSAQISSDSSGTTILASANITLTVRLAP